MKSTITEIKNILEGTNNKITGAEQVSELEDRMLETTEARQNKEEQIKRDEDILIDLRDNIKHINIGIIRVPKREERKKGYEKVFERIIDKMMLKLKLQYFGHLIQRTDSLEKTLLLGKIEGKKRRG